ncbi:AraC family transcriptional regulator [Vallitalea okinawensis]|uniref:AraC family transcriptional regulator n=1 Tax=Vallitalea okinawensis TaxID=2078660 RepID=UPI000CFE0161|nr:AraC family transcriptional regulator [Vallitalea okinawensis]
MNLYISIIHDTIEYIEENIHERLSLEDISRRFCVSEFHFNRMFKTVVGKTLKQYILGRKLTLAFHRLNGSSESVINIAYDFGFEYPEVFSRAFKKQFGFPPSKSSDSGMNINLVKKANVVERDIINYKGVLTLKGTCEYLKSFNLEGIYLEVDVNSANFEELSKSKCTAFLKESKEACWLEHKTFYTLVSCHGDEEGKYTIFYGKKLLIRSNESLFKPHLIPEGWYAKFVYHGDMFSIREAFTDDLYRWIMLKEIELNPNGIGMLNIYGADYVDNGDVLILVPIKNPN